MKLRLALEDKLMDVRLRDRLVAEGKLSATDVESYIKDLNDEDGNYRFLNERKEDTSTEQ